MYYNIFNKHSIVVEIHLNTKQKKIHIKKIEILEEANWDNLPDSFIINDIITRHTKEKPDSLNRWPIDDYLLDSNKLTMYSTLEKAMILKLPKVPPGGRTCARNPLTEIGA